jgi:hypothetical protein
VFVINGVRGLWRTAAEVPGSTARNADGGEVASVSRAPAGSCSAEGLHTGTEQTFVVSQN